MAARAPVRLEFADDMFARGHRGVGEAVVTQRVWRLDEAYDAARLRRVADSLAHGRLARRLHRAVVPGARDAWGPAGVPPALALEEGPIHATDVVPWLGMRHADPIDPEAGPSWRLAATNVDDGGAVVGSVVSLTVAHAVADGASIRDALMTVATGAEPLDLPEPPGGLARVRLETVDAVRQIGAISRWARARRRARRSGALPPVTAAPPVPQPERRASDEGWSAPRIIAEFDADAAAAAAARHGGTTNSWFIAVAAALLDAIGHAAPGAPIPIAVPISGFQPGDHRANSTRIARVEVTREALAARDLAVVRSACKEAYARVNEAGPGLSPIPLPLVQMLPDRVLRRLPQPPQPACLASNLGTLPEPFVRVMGDRVRSVTTAAGYPRLTAEQARAAGGGLLAWHAAAGPRSTLALIPAEPDRIQDAEAFRRLLVDLLASWDVDAELW